MATPEGNSTYVVSFILTPYGNIGLVKYLYFTLIFLWYFSIIVANTFLVVVVCVDKKLHEPMYLFLCSLLLSELFGSTTVYPCLLSNMLSDTHEVTLTYCFLQIFCLYSAASVEFCSLAAMAYDRYVSICHPLHYHVIMNNRRVCKIIALIWVCSFINFTVSFSFTVRLKFCGNIIDKVFCDHYLLTKLACSVTTVNDIADLLFAFFAIVLPLILIFYCYFKILTVCLRNFKDTKQKAISTCTPQIVSLVNLFLGCIFHFGDTRLEKTVTNVPEKLRIILSVYLLICQPILSPIMYGFNLPKIRNACKGFVFYRK
ncbi:putative gustatory receptor clone PTE01 [Myripristis murdjan]|uniref:putative gustatory receptor clone PTE01 n=1 Tax=Myripristis murdjan TaxID=586833 RepID=UPI00117610A6|nr:putative gustatory receptor clone PTE01 [Myripristis murdjan]